jgi:hypothetical protein
MMRLDGPISDRLRALFGGKVADWPAYRKPEVIRDMPEENYTGRTLSARYRHIGQHRDDQR